MTMAAGHLVRAYSNPASTCRFSRAMINNRALVDLVVAYSNRSDLREQLQQVAMILSETASQDDEPGSSADSEVRSATRWWSLRDRFSPEDIQLMIDLYRSGTTAKRVAEKFGVSTRSVTRLLHQRGISRERRAAHA
jgi:CRP-like cAMP-binding protein